MKIYLSPSDQYTNRCSNGDTEASHCKKIAQTAKKYLEKYGYTVKMGDNSKEGSYPTRVTESNKWGADLHIPIHTNAGGGQGTEVFCYTGNTNNKYVKGIYNAVAAASIGKDRGIKVMTGLYEIKATKALCVYIECEFHDTKGKWIDNNITKLGKAIADGVAKADGKNTTASSGTSTGKTTLYKVQVGAFESKENAEKLAAELTKKGYDTYITE